MYYGKCQVKGCTRMAEHAHHKFSQTKWAKRKHKELINHPANIQYVCSACHMGLGGKIDRFSELEFLEATKGGDK